MQDFFDRKTFDPVNNHTHRSTLNILRAYGGSRRVASTALDWALQATRGNRTGVFLDLGCGDSCDWKLAQSKGFDSYRLDLFPPGAMAAKGWQEDHPQFIKADVVEHIPFDDGSVNLAISQAMLDLVEPIARNQFFHEIDRVLKPEGVFVCSIQWLQSGYGFDDREEYERALKIWPNTKKCNKGFVARKGEFK